MKKIKINKGWFWSAGIKFAWEGDHIREGVGIKIEDLEKHDKIKLEVQGIEYEVSSKKALDFIEKYKSKFYAKNQTEIGIISRGILTRITPEPIKPEIIERDGERVARI